MKPRKSELSAADGTKVRELRITKNYSQEKLAALAGLSVRTVVDIELGHRPNGKQVFPTRTTMKKLASALQTDLTELLISRRSYSLSECREDFLEWERAFSDEDSTLRIRSIAIDLSEGFSNLVAAINHSVSRRLSVDILILGGELFDTVDERVPSAVRLWHQTAQVNLRHVAETLKTASFGDKQIDVKIKAYPEVPRLHGVACTIETNKTQRTRWWLTQCQHSPGTVIEDYNWGQDMYTICSDIRDCQNEALHFEQLFALLWKNQPTTEHAFRSDSARASLLAN